MFVMLIGTTRNLLSMSQPSRVPIPNGAYFSTAWLAGGWLVVHYEATDRFEYRPWRLRIDGSGFERLPLGDVPGCVRVRYQKATKLPDGRLGLVAGCEPSDVRHRASFNIVGYNIATQGVEPLLTDPIPYNPTQFSWNPGLTKAMFGHSSGICGSIAWLTRKGIERPDITLTDHGRGWHLGAFFDRARGEPCTREGRADLPAWSPNGHGIAFFASPQSIGVGGKARLDQPWNLYLMEPAGKVISPLLRNVMDPASLAWSPDSRLLAFTGTIRGRGPGLYVLDAASGGLERLLPYHLGGLDWAPDGGHLVGINQLSDPGDWPPLSQLLIVAVGRPASATGRGQTTGEGKQDAARARQAMPEATSTSAGTESGSGRT